jgi:hypothetical protein
MFDEDQIANTQAMLRAQERLDAVVNGAFGLQPRHLVALLSVPGFAAFLKDLIDQRQGFYMALSRQDISTNEGQMAAARLQGQIIQIDNIGDMILNALVNEKQSEDSK